ncbi:MAG: PAS domain S-box protein, partial [Caldilineaceae bacterium]|nr:PAS domain S-box protein [Caldilineaceae bacterium]
MGIVVARFQLHRNGSRTGQRTATAPCHGDDWCQTPFAIRGARLYRSAERPDCTRLGKSDTHGKPAQTTQRGPLPFLVQHGSDIITIVDAHGGIRYVSPAIERLLGYEPETILGTNLAQRLIHPSNFNAIENFYEM